MLQSRLPRIAARAMRSSIRTAPGQLRRAGHVAAEPAEYEYPKLTEAEDPGMNGGYINPPRIKRQFRDPYANWWDKQERRNFGEPVHEDNDILGMFSPYEYTHVKPKTAFLQIGYFFAAVFATMGVVSIYYPDKPSVPRVFEDGLERELGGPGAMRARAQGDE
ncbi:unnamed protein product [Blumeria hordei]|uniref:Uncharacterized protein n=2 Tax=Blumeria hordei TaxID=2867405 RepID=A0A383UUM5_BLUHO|nr:NADHubiquinone oxidoreductase 20.1kD subunit [Blumeria hordei DH14]SZF03050.1 unnamed protein product [Blumeria hordei]